MRKLLFVTALALISTALFSQARKPVIMVIPSDAYCVREGYVMTYDDGNGGTRSAPDYSKAFISDENLRLAVSELSTIMADRGFPLKDLEQTLKSMETQQAEAALFSGSGGGSITESPLDRLKRTAKADIIMDLDFSIKSRGPQKVPRPSEVHLFQSTRSRCLHQQSHHGCLWRRKSFDSSHSRPASGRGRAELHGFIQRRTSVPLRRHVRQRTRSDHIHTHDRQLPADHE